MGLKLFTAFGYKKKPSIMIGDDLKDEKVKPRMPSVKVTELSVGSVAKRSHGKRSPIKNVLRTVPSGSLDISESEPMYRTVSKTTPERSTFKPLNQMEMSAARAISALARPIASPVKEVRFASVVAVKEELAVMPKIEARKTSWASTGLVAVPTPAACENPEDEKVFMPGDEKPFVPGFITTDRPKDLSKRALGELASGDDDTKVLCAGPVNGLTVLGPREAADNIKDEAKVCAAYLLKHPIVGPHLVNQVKGGIVNVGDLKLALQKVSEDF